MMESVRQVVLALIVSFTLLYGLHMMTEFTDRELMSRGSSLARAEVRVETFRELAIVKSELVQAESELMLLKQHMKERCQ